MTGHCHYNNIYVSVMQARRLKFPGNHPHSLILIDVLSVLNQSSYVFMSLVTF